MLSNTDFFDLRFAFMKQYFHYNLVLCIIPKISFCVLWHRDYLNNFFFQNSAILWFWCLTLSYSSKVQLSSAAQSCHSLRPHGLQYARPPCPSPTPRIYSNSCPLSWWCHPTILSSVTPSGRLPSIFPSIRVFSNESVLCLRWPKYWSFSFNNTPSNEHSRLISFRIDWLDLLAVQETLKSLLQHHSSKHQFFGTQLSL